MIGYLRGTPKLAGNDIIVDVAGVGYLVHTTASLTAELMHKPEVELFIHTHVREDILELYGFRSAEEKRLFMLLLDVSGVGPRTALAITERSPQEIITAVQQADSRFFSSIPRVGKKVAQKIIIDLKGKLGSLKELDLGPTSSQEQEIVGALASLGFAEEDVLEQLRSEDYSALTLEASIKRIIQKLGKV
ncbi:MAG: holliday junction helicase RuvA [Patescibacteria group bacterium]|nr:holliday junction helicase RuvA [Patescibacteria group bacterium]